ncbi:sensor histidine kinase [Glaciimonas sp. GNP009]
MKDYSPDVLALFSTDESNFFSFAESLPWPVIIIRSDGEVAGLTKQIMGLDVASGLNDLGYFPTLFPAYATSLQGPVCWQIPQEVKLIRTAESDQLVHERLIMRRASTGSYLMIVDETKLRTLEVADIQTARLAAIGFMVAGVCHELSNPLAAIRSMVQILGSDQEKKSALLGKGLANIADNVQRLLGISDRLLNFGRVGDATRTGFQVDEAIGQAFSVMFENGWSAQIKVEFVRDRTALVFGNLSQLQEVFVNLFENAIGAMNGVGILSVRTKIQSNNSVVVLVSDTGPGIPDNILPRIFEPFFTTKTLNRGTGLGLAISSEILLEHRGLITAANNAHGGACFQVELPLLGPEL